MFNRTKNTFNIRNLIKWDKIEKIGGFTGHHCIICARKLNKNTAKSVHPVNGDISDLARIDETNIDESGDMGWWRIGSDCAKLIPSEYVA